MDYNDKTVFVNRHKYWRERQGLSATRIAPDETSTFPDHNEARKDDSASDLTWAERNAAFKNIRSCPHCGNSERALFRHIDVDDDKTKNHLAFTECIACYRLIGADDTMSQDTVNAWIKSMEVDICSCGNHDVEQYVLQEHDEHPYFLCKRCNSEVPIKALSEEKSEAELHKEDVLNLKCGTCCNDSVDAFSVYMTNDKVEAIECLVCDEVTYTQNIDDYPETPYPVETPAATSSPEEAKEARIVGRHAVKRATDLREGDHIAWWRPEQYWHHALVKVCHAVENAVTVIHYNGPSPGGIKKLKGKILEEKLELERQSGILYKMIYSGSCFSARTAIERATTRMGECTYNFFTNNCEHFVRWCKTGEAICEQVLSAVQFAKDHYRKMFGMFSKTPMEKGLGLLAGGAVAETGAIVGNLSALGGMVIVGFEIIKAVEKINHARKQRADGHISRPEFINVVVRNTFEATLSGAGTIAGTLIGSYMCIPIVGSKGGSFIGSTLGAMLGTYIGSVIGYQFAKYHNQ